MPFFLPTTGESLREMKARPSTQPATPCNMVIRFPISRSTCADANERRDWRIHADFPGRVIAQARKPYTHEDWGVELP